MNIGHPAPMEWDGKSIVSSMHKHPVPGPLVVHKESIEGNTFANPAAHGTPDFLLYAYGMPSALSFTQRIGRSDYQPGAAGETLTLDELDETKVSVGDTFRIGEVVAQACFPRIPCGKVNYRMRHEHGQRAMQECGRSGVYFRILQPGKIAGSDVVQREITAPVFFSIFEVYSLVVKGLTPTDEQLARAEANGAFPVKFITRWQEAARG